jgi:spore germination protein KA
VTDSVLDSGTLEAYIQDAPYSIFYTVGNSERPDVVSSRLLEGRVAILSDGSPFVLTVPMLYIENFQSAGDYSIKFYYASVLRILRLLSLFLATMIPAIYVALATFHQELIPTTLLYTFVTGHKAIPLPTILEALVMLFFFDIMFEAGVRLPKSVGSAVSIVGALVIGEAAVSAGLISAPMVIVVALTAISSFVVSPQTYPALILRYFFTILGGTLGGFGIVMGLMVVLFNLFSLKSFGVPYLSTLYPSYSGDLEDSFIIFPIWKMHFRSEALSSPNKTRRRGGPSSSSKPVDTAYQEKPC